MNIELSADEFNAVIAALRYWQERGQCEPDNRTDDMHELATDGGEGQSLSDDEMDSFIERINSEAINHE